MSKYSGLHSLKKLHVSFVSSSSLHLMVQLQNDLILKLQEKKKGKRGDQWEMIKQIKRGMSKKSDMRTKCVLLFESVTFMCVWVWVCVSVCEWISVSKCEFHRFCMFLPCWSFQSVCAHRWSCQRRWELWPFSTLPLGSMSFPGWGPPYQEWNRSYDCLKDKHKIKIIISDPYYHAAQLLPSGTIHRTMNTTPSCSPTRFYQLRVFEGCAENKFLWI